MTRRERVFTVLEGKAPDRPPTGFWLHFPAEQHHGEAAIAAHLDFMAETDTDILKVMNENIFHKTDVHIETADHLGRFYAYGRADATFTDQEKILRSVCGRAKGEYPILATLHGLVASVFHQTVFAGKYATEGGRLAEFCRQKPEEMQRVFALVADSLIDLVDLSLAAGADGIFYAALGGEARWFSHQEYMQHVAPHEKRIYDHIKQKTRFDVLHMCKTGIDYARFAHLAPTVVNWSVHGNHLPLSEGAKLFPQSIVLGGFQDRAGVLVDGDEAAIEQKTAQLLQEMAGRPYIVGSDCTLPTEISLARIRQVVQAVEKLSH